MSDSMTDASLDRHATAGDPVASGLIAHIQAAMEHQKALLARELHDELGGLLVGAVMDLAWAEQHINSPTEELRLKLVRARQTLAAAIDMKRKLIEDLRPTLLDNVGLYAALRWHVQSSCKRAGFPCTVNLPEDERRFLNNVPIALFRIVQEALLVIAGRKPVGATDFSVTVDRRTFAVLIQSHPAGPPADPDAGTSEAEGHCLAAIEQRVASLGGEFRHNYSPSTGTQITVRFPLDAVLAANSP